MDDYEVVPDQSDLGTADGCCDDAAVPWSANTSDGGGSDGAGLVVGAPEDFTMSAESSFAYFEVESGPSISEPAAVGAAFGDPLVPEGAALSDFAPGYERLLDAGDVPPSPGQSIEFGAGYAALLDPGGDQPAPGDALEQQYLRVLTDSPAAPLPAAEQAQVDAYLADLTVPLPAAEQAQADAYLAELTAPLPAAEQARVDAYFAGMVDVTNDPAAQLRLNQEVDSLKALQKELGDTNPGSFINPPHESDSFIDERPLIDPLDWTS